MRISKAETKNRIKEEFMGHKTENFFLHQWSMGLKKQASKALVLFHEWQQVQRDKY